MFYEQRKIRRETPFPLKEKRCTLRAYNDEPNVVTVTSLATSTHPPPKEKTVPSFNINVGGGPIRSPNKRAMNLKFTGSMWRQFGLDDPVKYEIARSAFYIGYGFEAVKSILTANPDCSEVTELLRVAPLLGMIDEDVITKV